MEILIIYIGATVVVGILAAKRNRNVALWVILSLVVSPLIAGLIVLALGEAEPQPPVRYISKEEARNWQQPGAEPRVAQPETKVCPDCAEEVKAEVKICRYCRHEFA